MALLDTTLIKKLRENLRVQIKPHQVKQNWNLGTEMGNSRETKELNRGVREHKPPSKKKELLTTLK